MRMLPQSEMVAISAPKPIQKQQNVPNRAPEKLKTIDILAFPILKDEEIR